VVRTIQPTIFQRFFRTETAGGSVLLLFGIAALVLANSPLAGAYERLWQTRLTFGIAVPPLSLTLHQWINDGLMAVFFLLVGLEIKRELIIGELASVRKAALPIACAIGGMIVPAAFYWICNTSGPNARGWGIPMATDIAFALGALALIAPNAPAGARVFLAALAIADDMGAVLVIAIFYSHALVWTALVAAALIVALLIGLNAMGVRHLWPYLLAGIGLWYFMHESGVHATVAGVALAFTIPTHTRINAPEFSRKARRISGRFDRTAGVAAPILRLERSLHNFSAFVVMPLFAFANAGVRIGGPLDHAEVTVGVILGLVVGKPLGITAAALGAVKSGIGELPRGVGWTSLLGYACLAGIGFTMSLFITMLAFDETALVNAAKSGILAGSLLAGIGGAIILKSGPSRSDMEPPQRR
jgi:Na+:H+ antiporter, NhaA family